MARKTSGKRGATIIALIAVLAALAAAGTGASLTAANPGDGGQFQGPGITASWAEE